MRMVASVPDDARANASPDPGGSSLKSDHTELHVFAGPAGDVAVKLFSLPQELVMRTFYVLLLQGQKNAEVRIFWRAGRDSRQGSVDMWQGSGLGDLPSRVMTLITENNAEDLRQALISVMSDYCDFQSLGIIPCPISARGAFGHPLRLFAKETMVQAYVVAV